MPLLLPHLADEWGNANLGQNSLYEINAQNNQSKAKQPPPSDSHARTPNHHPARQSDEHDHLRGFFSIGTIVG
jgi:hypothetical protein